MPSKSFSRSDRIGDMIQKTLGNILMSESRDPRLRTVSITSVTLQPDRKKAHIYFTLFEPEEAKEVEKVLNKASGFFRQALAKQTDLKYTPILNFVYDSSIIEASNLSKKIDDI